MKTAEHKRILRAVSARHEAEMARLKRELAECQQALAREQAFSEELGAELKRIDEIYAGCSRGRSWAL